jgi:hypothetical protein
MQQTIQKSFQKLQISAWEKDTSILATEISDPHFPHSKAFPQVECEDLSQAPHISTIAQKPKQKGVAGSTENSHE